MRARLLGSIRGESDRRACGAPSDQREVICVRVLLKAEVGHGPSAISALPISAIGTAESLTSPVATRIEVSKGRCDNGFSSRVAAS